MTDSQAPLSSEVSCDYGKYYYSHCCGDEYVRNENWLGVFRHFANCISSGIAPLKVLDAGCAKGFLVEALREKGIEAFGVDISEFAIGQAYEAIRPFLAVASLTEPLVQKYDLIVSIEVLEHIPAPQALIALENICSATEDVLFSSSPFDYAEPTHINVHPPEYWAAAFARHGFYRDFDFDGSFLTPWAVRFRKDLKKNPLEIVAQYERKFWQLSQADQGSRVFATKLQNEIAAILEKTQLTTLSQLNLKMDEIEKLKLEVAECKKALQVELESQLALKQKAFDDASDLQNKIQSYIASDLVFQNSKAGKFVQLVRNLKSFLKTN